MPIGEVRSACGRCDYKRELCSELYEMWDFRVSDTLGCGILCSIDYVDAKLSEKHAIFSFRVFTGLKL